MEYMDLAIAGIVFGASIIGLIGGLVLIVVALRNRALRKTEEHKERLALIERGLVVPGGPHRLDDMLGAKRLRPDSPARRRDGAVWMIGLGLAAALFCWLVVEDLNLAIGIGGALVVMGLTYFLSSFVVSSESTPPPESGSGQSEPPPPPASADPDTPV